MAEFNKTFQIKSDETGTIRVSEEVVAIIAGLAATEIEGVSSMAGNITNEIVSKLGMKNLSKGIFVEVLDEEIKVDVALNIAYGYAIPDISTKVQEKVKDQILMIPRIYTNKPRTTGHGYKGMLHQPDPDAKPDMYKGIVAIRELHLAALRDYDFSCADEMLYPENYRYLSDLLSYVAIGARSVENQQHRLTASGIEVPVGMKNPTGGDLSVMMNSITAAQSGHTFLYRGWEVSSLGNPWAHSILRGYLDYTGKSVSNYHYENLVQVNELYMKSGLVNPSVIVDTNHNNSGKQYLEQIRIAKDVVYSRNQNDDIKRLVKGLMIESYLEDGAQGVGDHVFGKSITDPCLGWEKTEQLIFNIADNL